MIHACIWISVQRQARGWKIQWMFQCRVNADKFQLYTFQDMAQGMFLLQES